MAVMETGEEGCGVEVWSEEGSACEGFGVGKSVIAGVGGVGAAELRQGLANCSEKFILGQLT